MKLKTVILRFFERVFPVNEPETFGYPNQEFTLVESDANVLIEQGIADEVENATNDNGDSTRRRSSKRDGLKNISKNRQRPRGQSARSNGSRSRKGT